MNRLASFFSARQRWAWVAVGSVSIAIALVVGLSDARGRRLQRLTLLQIEAQRSSIEILSTTMNGNLMGAVTLLGLLDGDIKREATDGRILADAQVVDTLSAVGNSSAAEGVFVVGESGIVQSSWDRAGKTSTGLDVRFRPYYQTAMRGQNSVYAAVSMARGDRSIYFSAPVFAERARASNGVGAVVARTNLTQVDAMLSNRFDLALLLSPQGVVFASNQDRWIGALDGEPSPQRLKAIRELKQFGPLFERADPRPLPLNLTGGFEELEERQYAVATAPVQWNDPTGDWKLVVLEDMGRTVPVFESAWKAALSGVLTLLLGWMWLHLLKGRHARDVANAQLQVFASRQQAVAQYRQDLSAAALQLQRCETIEQLAGEFLTHARDLLNAPQGLLYVADPETSDLFLLAGSSACAEPPPDVLEIGDGLLGQCGLDRVTRVIATPPNGVWNLRSGLGDASPAAIMLGPVIIQDKLIGLVELTVIQYPDDAALDNFAELLTVLASSLEILRRNLLLKQMANHSANATEINP